MTVTKKLADIRILDSSVEIKCIEQVIDDDGNEYPPRNWRGTLSIGQDNEAALAEIAKHCSEEDMTKIRSVLASVSA